jgi:hypothetical protein
MGSTSRTHGTMRLSLFALPLLLTAAGGHAASGWLDKLRDALGGRSATTTALTAEDVGDGLREALRIGTERVVTQLGTTDGFNLDPAIRIPLPDQLDKAKSLLARVGMDASLVDLETRLNRAAEIATPRAKALFLDAISDMTLDDAMAIYNGPDDAATQYFKSRMSEPLAVEMRPIVDASLADAGAMQVYGRVMERYQSIPFAPVIDADLGGYVVSRATDGIFFYLAKEEAAIRADPARRTTDLLRRVFGR